MNASVTINKDDDTFVKPEISILMEFSLEEAEYYFSNIEKEIFNSVNYFKKKTKERFGFCSDDDIKRFKQDSIITKQIKITNFDLTEIKKIVKL